MKRLRGFTLIELMVVVVIIAVLAAVAIPMYGKYAFRARRADGQDLLQRISMAQERFYATHNKYGTLADIGFENPAISEKGYYSVSLAFPGNNSLKFLATAAPLGAQQNDDCASLTVNNAGVRDATGSTTNGKCW